MASMRTHAMRMTSGILSFALHKVNARENISKFYGELDEDLVSFSVIELEGDSEKQHAFVEAATHKLNSYLSPPVVVSHNGCVALAWQTWQDSLEIIPTEYEKERLSLALAAIAKAIDARADGALVEDIATTYEGPDIDGVTCFIKGGGRTQGVTYSPLLFTAEQLGCTIEEEKQEEQQTEPEWWEKYIYHPGEDDDRSVSPLLLCGGEALLFPEDFMLIVGPRKSGKSTFISSIVATATCDDVQALNLSRPEGQERMNVVIFDTEQSRKDIEDKDELTKSLTGGSLDFVRFKLKGESPTLITKAVNDYIKTRAPQIAIIDGVTSLIPGGDINDERSSVELVKNIQRWSKDGTAIIGVIHPGGSALGNHKARGHIGSEAENQAEVICYLSGKDDGVRKIVFESRHYDHPKPFSFIKDDDGLHVISDEKGRLSTSWADFDWQDYMEPGISYTRDWMCNTLRQFKPDITTKYLNVRLSSDVKDGILNKDGIMYILKE